MDRDCLKTLLEQYVPSEKERQANKSQFLRFVERNERCFDRSLEEGHVTVSAWLLSFDRSQALLTHHRKLNQWMQLGGHCEMGDSDPLSAAIREAQEESGLTSIAPVRTDLFDIDIHAIPATAREPAHLHYDARFLLYAANPKEEVALSEESHELKWIGKDDPAIFMTDPSVVRLFMKWMHG